MHWKALPHWKIKRISCKIYSFMKRFRLIRWIAGSGLAPLYLDFLDKPCAPVYDY